MIEWIKKKARQVREWAEEHPILAATVVVMSVAVTGGIAYLVIRNMNGDEELIATLAENSPTAEEIGQEKIVAYTEKSVRIMDAVGFGGSVYLIFLAPLVLLFSYIRIPKNKQFSMLIPMIAAGLILVMYLEGFYRGVGILAQQQGFNLGEILSGM